MCKQSSTGKYVVFNKTFGKHVDLYSFKTLEECRKVVTASRYGVTCISSDSSKRVSLYDYHRDAFLGHWNKPLDECIDEL